MKQPKFLKPPAAARISFSLFFHSTLSKMADNAAESSSQALEKYLASQLLKLGLEVPSDDVEYMARFVEEDGLEVDEKVEGVKGMLEGVVEGVRHILRVDDKLTDQGLPSDTDAHIDEILLGVVAEWDRLLAVEASRLAETNTPSPTISPPPELPGAALSEKEIARLHAMRYAYVEGDLAELYVEDGSLRPQGAPPKGVGASEAEAKRAAEEKRQKVLEALRLDGKKKKHKKQQEGECLMVSADV